jgi:two-component system, NtrC family, response regulator
MLCEKMTKILIIDDDHTMCKILSRMVNKIGFDAVCEHTLDAGLNEALSNPYDVVLLDVQLPDGVGLDILPKIRKTLSSPEVIIMTGFGDEDGAEIAIKSGAWDYIQKTDSPRKIILPLQRVIQYRSELKREKKYPVALNLDGIIGNSSQMKSCFDLLAQAARSDVNVLITGETGTGKELFTRAIHKNSKRSEQNFVIVDCTALPKTLVESLLFGHKKGAFTGADETREGLVLQAHGGTLFLDEVGELPYSIQKVFLRVLQDYHFRPVGGKQEVKSDFRLVAATNRNLDQWVQAGRFRDDLLYRLRALRINLPPLREHPEDIGQMAIYYVTKLCERHQLDQKGFSPEFIEALAAYHWPGNVRELIKTLEVAVIAAGSSQILFSKHLPENIRIQAVQMAVKKDLPSDVLSQKPTDFSDSFLSLKKFRKTAAVQAEREYLQELVSLTKGDIISACRISELSRSRFYELIKKYSISIPS